MSTLLRRLEGDDRVHSSGGQVAEGERQRAHHAGANGEADQAGDLFGDEIGPRRLEGQDLDPLLRARPVERTPVQERALAAPRNPLLAASEVLDETELDVVHTRARGNGEREREEGDAPLGVQASVDRVADDRQPVPAVSERALA